MTFARVYSCQTGVRRRLRGGAMRPEEVDDDDEEKKKRRFSSVETYFFGTETSCGGRRGERCGARRWIASPRRQRKPPPKRGICTSANLRGRFSVRGFSRRGIIDGSAAPPIRRSLSGDGTADPIRGPSAVSAGYTYARCYLYDVRRLANGFRLAFFDDRIRLAAV